MGYRKTTLINVLLAETCVPRVVDRLKFLGMNYITGILSKNNHVQIPILNKIQSYIDDPTTIIKFSPPLLLECFNKCNGIAHLIFTSQIPMHCLYADEVEFTGPNICYDLDMQVKESNNPVQAFSSGFIRSEAQHVFYTDGSKSENLPFVRFAYVDITNNRCSKFRISNKTSIFSCEAIAMLSALKTARECRTETVIFSDSMSVLLTLELMRKREKSYLV